MNSEERDLFKVICEGLFCECGR